MLLLCALIQKYNGKNKEEGAELVAAKNRKEVTKGYTESKQRKRAHYNERMSGK